MVDRGIISELGRWDGGNGFAVVFDNHHAVPGHLTHFGPWQIPLVENPFDLFLAAFVDNDEHPLLRFAQQDFVRRHVWRSLRHLGQVDLDAGSAASRCLTGRAGETGSAHVLNARDRTCGE